MAKTFVALLVLLLAVVGPAAAQDSDPPSEDGDPEPQPSGDPAGGNETEGANETDPAPSMQQTMTCRVAATHLLDPSISPTRWVIPDPDGCFRVLIERVLSPPVTIVVRFFD